ncbi:hypothetical protein MY10362_005769 [Beauveria mimosiformis]
MASAHRRHRDSLERLINFSSSPPLTEEARNQAETRFYAIVDHFRDQDPSKDEYDRTALVRYTYEYALTEKAKDNLLQAFFGSITIPLTDTVDVDLTNKEKENEIWSKLAGFADYLLNNFFLPFKTNSDVTLDSSREGALQILNMFDTDVVHFIEGPDIDRPRNAMTLTHNLHQDFGDFQIYFEPEAQANTYRINTFLPAAIHNFLPVTRELFLTEDRTIEPPSPRFLAIHRAIAHILHLSAAGAFIDTILNDFDQRAVRADGTTHLGELVNLKVNGWLSRPVAET